MAILMYDKSKACEYCYVRFFSFSLISKLLMSLSFSVLLSLYFKESPIFLRQSLESVFNQTLSPNEVVLVKDGPLTNELEQVLSEYTVRYPNLKIVSLPQNQGLGKALNEGLKHCSYDLVARMDTDDICKLNRFEKQIEVFKENPEVDIISSWIDEFEGESSNVISTRRLPKTHDEIYRYAQKRNPMNHPVVMFKKKSVLAAGGYMHFHLFEDYYLWVRMLLNGAKFYNVQESLLLFRFSSDMFKRRGGFKYACTEAKFQWHIYKLGFLSFNEACLNIFIRFGSRVIPNGLRSWMYKKILRR